MGWLSEDMGREGTIEVWLSDGYGCRGRRSWVNYGGEGGV